MRKGFNMNKKYIIKICNVSSSILAVIFVIKCILDYRQYNSMLNSAPFYLGIVVNAIYLLVPAFVLFIITKIIAKKQ